MKELKTSLDFKRAIKIIDFNYDSNGVRCDYTLDGKELAFIADPVLMANKLKEYGLINYYREDNGEVLVLFESVMDDSDEHGYHRQKSFYDQIPIKEYMLAWAAYDWVNFLGKFEYDKAFYGKDGALKTAYKTAYDKHSKVG